MDSDSRTFENQKIAVLLINMGGPENPGEIKSFLANLFNDRHIINMPQPFRFVFSRIMATARFSMAKKHYGHIGGGSPLKKWTELQAEKLFEKLSDNYSDCIVHTAYSYSSPFIAETVRNIIKDNPDKIVALPLYPQFSVTTFGSISDDLEIMRKKLNLGGKLVIVSPYYKHPLYIRAVSMQLTEALEKVNRTLPYRVIFTAHSLPQSVIDRGDPYRKQIEETVSLVLKTVPLKDYTISYQSKIGPVKWMRPSTIETVQKAGDDGLKQLVVMPIGFVCDHIETLYELDIELAGIVQQAGIEKFIRGDVFNDSDCFIELLETLVRENIK